MPFDLDRFLPYRLSVAATQVSRRFAERYGVEAGLSIAEWRVLAHLDKSGPVSVRDINMRVNLDKSVVSRAADRLEKAGFVQKSAHERDQRLVALTLTGAGQALMERLGQVAEDFQKELIRELGEDEGPLRRALDKIIDRRD